MSSMQAALISMRNLLGLTIERLADLSGLTPDEIIGAEKGTSPPPDKLIDYLTDQIRVSPMVWAFVFYVNPGRLPEELRANAWNLQREWEAEVAEAILKIARENTA